MPRIGPIRAMDTIAVDRARPRIGQKAVPHIIGIFGEHDTFELLLTGIVEDAELDLGGVRGEQREVHPQSGPGRAERMRQAFAQARSVVLDRRRQAPGRSGAWIVLHEAVPSGCRLGSTSRGRECSIPYLAAAQSAA